MNEIEKANRAMFKGVPPGCVAIGPADDENIVGAERPNPAEIDEAAWKLLAETSAVKAMIKAHEIEVLGFAKGKVRVRNRTRNPLTFRLPTPKPAVAA